MRDPWRHSYRDEERQVASVSGLPGPPTSLELWEVEDILKSKTRNPHTCITKRQLVTLAEKLLIENAILQKKIQEMQQ